MPKQREKELVRATHFSWLLGQRDGVWYADGRSNKPSVGRHSLNTRNKTKAMTLLQQLDQSCAAKAGLVPHFVPQAAQLRPLLSLEDGRKKFTEFIGRPKTVGGLKRSTQKRYRPPFDKFIPFAADKGIRSWNELKNATLEAYATYLDEKDYASKTIHTELSTLLRAHRWLLKEGHLADAVPLTLKLKKYESERAYCYTTEQVRAMVDLCKAQPKLLWLQNALVVLAHTGLRISEAASLRWSDIDFENNRITLSDESGYKNVPGVKRREVKSSRSRCLPLNPDLATTLLQIPRVGATVLLGARGGRLKPDTVRLNLLRHVITPLVDRFPSVPDEQGFKDGRLHSFRHFFASWCANEGIPERIVMEWLGHKDSAMVRHYYHLHDTESKRQMNKLSLLRGPGSLPAGDDNGAAPSQSETPPST